MQFLRAHASQYTGGGVEQGIQEAQQVAGSGDLRSIAQAVLSNGLTLMGGIAVLVIVIAGVMMIINGGDDATRQRAIRAVLYVVAGLILILIASAIVQFVANNF